MNIFKIYYLALIAITLVAAATPCSADAGPFWNLPASVTDKTLSVKFEVDSTWHLIHGTTKNLSGRVWLADPNDYTSVRGELVLPINAFDTDNADRDERMREVMGHPRHPEVTVSFTNASNICDPQSLSPGQSCGVTLTGLLTIRGVSKPISLQATAAKRPDGFEVTGTHTISWEDFGVEDPSILIAKLQKNVKISFKLLLPSNAEETHGEHS